MKELLNLGELYVSDFIKEGEQPRGKKVEMKIIRDDRGIPRLEKTADLDTMYGKYWYRSGTNATMKKELKGIADSITSIYKLSDNDVWLDIACNDGEMFKHMPNNVFKLGIDPADNSFKEEAEKIGNAVIQDYFSAKAYNAILTKRASVITSIAMFYDVEDYGSFLKDIYNVLDDDGLWVMQLSYTPLMLKQIAFDNICHEHIYYYSLENLSDLLKDYGFKVMDCQLNDTNGGSFRVYIMKDVANKGLFGTQPYRDVCNFRVDSIYAYEYYLGLNEDHQWEEFKESIEYLKQDVVPFIQEVVKSGSVVMGYGASTKGNTLLQYFGLDSNLITSIAERNPQKWGLKTVGTNIPIISEEAMRKAQPDYLLVLPWHFISEFKERESEYLNKGGKFIIPCPKFKIICQ